MVTAHQKSDFLKIVEQHALDHLTWIYPVVTKFSIGFYPEQDQASFRRKYLLLKGPFLYYPPTTSSRSSQWSLSFRLTSHVGI